MWCCDGKSVAEDPDEFNPVEALEDLLTKYGAKPEAVAELKAYYAEHKEELANDPKPVITRAIKKIAKEKYGVHTAVTPDIQQLMYEVVHYLESVSVPGPYVGDNDLPPGQQNMCSFAMKGSCRCN
jgi:hypothetical protein